MAPGFRLLSCCSNEDDAGDSKEGKAEPARQAEPTSNRKTSVKKPDFTPQSGLASVNQEKVKDETAGDDKATTQPSLWDTAYSQLRAADEDLVKKYEELLSAELSPKSANSNVNKDGVKKSQNQFAKDPKIRKEQLDQIIRQGKERLEEERISYTIAGHKFILDEQIANAAEFMLWGKGLVDEAVKASTEASLAWAGVCMVLPLLTHPFEARQANEEGYVYVTARLKYYTAMESTLFPSSGDTTHRNKEAMASFTEHLLKLYKAILEYELKTAVRLLKSSFKRVLRDVRESATWKEMVDKIKTIQNDIHADLKNINDDAMITSLNELEKSAEDNNNIMKKHLEIAEEQLQVLKETRDIHMTMLNLKKYGIRIEQNAIYDAEVVGSKPCQDYTRMSIRKEITDWAVGPNVSDGSTVFWLSGPAGMGKSAIAQTIAHEFADSGQLGASYFFKRPERSRANLFFPTIASALVHSIPPLEKYVYQSMDEQRSSLGDQGIETKSLATQFDTLIFKPLQTLSEQSSIVWTRLLVIDALDECDEIDNVQIICQLLIKLRGLRCIRLRILLTSRDDPPIGPVLRRAEKDGTARIRSLLDFLEDSKSDIRVYLRTCLADIKDSREVTKDPWPSSTDFEQLFTLATTPSSLFIYVATFHRSLRDLKDEAPESQLKSWLENKHKDSELAKTYGPVIERLLFRDAKKVERISENNKALLKLIIGTIILLNSPLSSSSLANLLGLDLTDVDNWIKNLRAVLYFETGQHKALRILHTSFRDFLLDGIKSAGFDFWIDETQTHKLLAKNCSRLMQTTLEKNICQLTDPSVLVSEVGQDLLDRSLPLEVRYACLNWVGHVEKSGAVLDNDDYKFLQNCFLYWLEAMAWMEKLSEAIDAITSLEGMALNSKIPNLREFVYDMKRFALFSRSSIEEAPLHLYCSAILFAPSKSLVRQHFLANAPRFILTRLVEENWTACIQTLNENSAKAEKIAYSAKSGLLASGADDGTITIWDPSTGAALQRFPTDRYQQIRALSFSPDGTLLASAFLNQKLMMLDLSLGELVYIEHRLHNEVRSLSFAPSGAFLAVHFYPGIVEIWKVISGSSLDSPVRVHVTAGRRNWQLYMVFSPTEDLLAIAAGTEVLIWDAKIGICVWKKKAPGLYSLNDAPLSFSIDGKVLALVAGRTVALWEVSTGLEIGNLSGHTDAVFNVAFSPSNPDLLASSSFDSTIRIWSASSRMTLRTLKTFGKQIIFLDHGETQLLVLNSSGRLSIWDTSIDTTTALNPTPEEFWVSRIALSSDLSMAALASLKALIWDLNEGVIKAGLEIGRDIQATQFSLDGKLLITETNSSVEVRDVTTGDEVLAIKKPMSWELEKLDQDHQYLIPSGLSPDGKLLALPLETESNVVMKLWGVERRDFVMEVKLPSQRKFQTAIAFSLDATQLALATPDRICVYSTTDGEQLKELYTWNEAETIAYHMYFSPDGKQLAFATLRTIWVWNLGEGGAKTLLKLPFPDDLGVLAYSLNGLLAVTTGDEIILVKATTLTETGRIPLGRSGRVISRMSFSQDGSVLNTNCGSIDIPSLSARLFLKGQWIYQGKEKLLWIHPEYGPNLVDYRDGTFLLGRSGSDRVLTLSAPESCTKR